MCITSVCNSASSEIHVHPNVKSNCFQSNSVQIKIIQFDELSRVSSSYSTQKNVSDKYCTYIVFHLYESSNFRTRWTFSDKHYRHVIYQPNELAYVCLNCWCVKMISDIHCKHPFQLYEFACRPTFKSLSWTNCFLQLLFTWMISHMCLQTTWCSEMLMTNKTFVWLFTWMTSHMCIQITGFSKLFVTNIAFVSCFIRMNYHMSL